jgi:hypothetical protein
VRKEVNNDCTRIYRIVSGLYRDCFSDETLESCMKAEPTDYGMFTSEGNRAVDLLVELARDLKLEWPQVYTMLCGLAADQEKYGEAIDTAVRENVYAEIGYEPDAEPFYFKF